MERKPEWLRVRYNQQAVSEVAELMRDLKLNTVCKAANCPNLGECYQKHTATFMLLGDVCTRNCRFCNVTCGKPLPPDPDEPENVAQAAERLGLRHVVLTCATRDDLPDGGAAPSGNVKPFSSWRRRSRWMVSSMPKERMEKTALAFGTKRFSPQLSKKKSNQLRVFKSPANSQLMGCFCKKISRLSPLHLSCCREL